MIHITKRGFEHLEWDSKIRQNTIIPFNPMRALREGITFIEEGVTVGDIIRFVSDDEFLNIFFTEYCSCPIEEFIEALDNPDEHVEKSDLFYVRVDSCFEVSINRHSDLDSKGRPRWKAIEDRDVQFSLQLHGVGPSSGDEEWWGRKKGEIIDNFSVSELPMEQLGVLPIKLTDYSMFTLHDYKLDAPDRYRVVDERNLHYCPSLLEFLDCILYDISFNGGPKERASFAKELKMMANDVINGTAKLIPFKFDKDDER